LPAGAVLLSIMQRRSNPLCQTLAAPADYSGLVAVTKKSALKSTLPVDEKSYAALLAIRSDVLAGIYSEILEPS